MFSFDKVRVFTEIDIKEIERKIDDFSYDIATSSYPKTIRNVSMTFDSNNNEYIAIVLYGEEKK